MRVALVNPPFSQLVYGTENVVKGVTPALGLFYLQSMCKDVAEIKIFEGESFVDLNALICAVNEFSPDVLGVTTNTSTYPYCRLVAESVRAGTKVAGGPYSTFRIEETLKTFDIVFVGDAEASFREFLCALPLESIPGIAFRGANGSVIHTGSPSLPPLDALPFPDPSRIELRHYRASPHRELPEPFATMMTTRGCGFRCTFCLSAKNGMNNGRYRERSVQNVIDEIRLLQERYQVRSIQFWDDTFTMRKERTRALSGALRPLGLSYVCNTRTDKIDAETAELLAESGCKSVFFGVESGSEGVLSFDIQKDTRNEQVRRAVTHCKRSGLRVTSSFILGSPNDTEGTVEETIQFALSLDSDFVLFNIYTAHPGTEGYNVAIQEGIINEYSVDTNAYCGEPVGAPTVCKALNRRKLQIRKAQAYLRHYRQRGQQAYEKLIETYERELTRLTTSGS